MQRTHVENETDDSFQHMKIILTRATLLALFITQFFAANNTWARLPKPAQESGIVLAVDMHSQTLVFKRADGKKPVLLIWNKDTQFACDGKAASPSQLKAGTSIVVLYKDVSFSNPLLKKVSWTTNPK